MPRIGLTARATWTSLVCVLVTGLSLRGWISSDEGSRTLDAAGLHTIVQRHLAVIAAEPRPLGSRHHDQVAQYLVTESRSAGADVTADTVPVVREIRGGPLVAGVVTNVVAVVRGTQSDRALLVVGHYDTVPLSPGASDDGVSVAAMLAAMRALTKGPRPRNDVVFLFSDGEEAGRLGAAAFRQHDRNSARVAAVLNFEARGSAGNPILFETGADNGWIVPLFANALRKPLATSLAPEVYRYLPNDTDFSAFRDAGIPGLNIASIDGFARYHTIGDDVAHLDAAMVRERTNAVLHLTRAAADAQLDQPRAPGLTYFTVPGGLLVRYPLRWSFTLAVLSLTLLIVVVRRSARLGIVRPRQALLCAIATVIAMLSSAVLSFLLWRALRPMRDDRPFPQNGGYSWAPYLAGFACLGVAAVAALRATFARRVHLTEQLAGAGVVSVAFALVTARFAPGASYIFTLPALAAALSLFASRPSPRRPWLPWAMWSVSALVIATVTVPVVYLLSVALGPTGLSVASLLTVWIAASMAPAFPQPAGRQRLSAAAAVAVLGAGLLLTGKWANRFDADHPRPSARLRLTDTAAGRSVRASTDFDLDADTAAWLGPARRLASPSRYLPEITRPIWMSEAPYTHPPGVDVSQLRRPPDGDGASFLDMRALDAGASLDLRFEPGVRVATLELQGTVLPLPPRAETTWLQVWAPPDGALSVGVHVTDGMAVKFSAVTRTFGGESRRPESSPPPFGFDAGDVTAARSDFLR